jgi:hypothetical protein
MADIRIKDLPLNTPVLSTDIFVFEKSIGGGAFVTSQNTLSQLGGVGGGQGVQGTSGTSQGVQGTIGNQGIQGLVGNQGDQGVQGIIGGQGITGDQGVQGLTGVGTQGAAGDQGVQGIAIQGNQGVQGVIGTQGNQGVQGVAGDQGVQGLTGAGTQGATGDQGVQGVAGDQGVQGIGNQGVQGPAGSTQGTQGASGSQGLTGDQGIQGIIGDQGVQGVGNQGVQGTSIQGVQGDQGVQGTSIQGVQGIIGTTFDYTEVTSSITLQSNNGYIFDTTLSALTATLPASPNTGDYINITLTRGGSNNLTIDRNGKNIDGIAEDLTCDVSGTFSLIYVGSGNNWKFVPFSGLTTPVIKIYKATWLGPYATSGTADNLGNNSRVPYNTNSINTDTATFGGLQNPGSKTQTAIHIKTTGYYKIESNLHLFDQAEDRNLYVQLWTFDSVNNDVLRTAISDYRGPGTVSDNDLIIKGDYIINITQPNTYVYIVVNHNFPGDGPYPSDNDSTSGGSTAPTELTITKLA